MRIEFAALSDTGRRRLENQDRVLAFELRDGRGYVFAVADGVGGLAGGSRASQAAIEQIASAFDGRADLDDPTGLLVSGIKDANRHMVEGQERGEPGNTTIVAVVAWAGRFSVAHVGDSRSYLLRDGELAQLTEDHSLVAEQVRAGILTQSEASSSRYRNVITRSIGTLEGFDVEVRDPEGLLVDDTLLLCSDGLHGVLPTEEIVGVLSSGSGAGECVERLVGLANERGGPDNISVIVATVRDLS